MFYQPDPKWKRGLLHTLVAGMLAGAINAMEPRDNDRWETDVYAGKLVRDPHDDPGRREGEAPAPADRTEVN